MKRPTESTEYLRHTFTDAERLQMGTDLAAAHNRLAAIDEEEAVVKAKFKERRTTMEQSIGSLSRDIEAGWTMQNIPCRLDWGNPNPTEVAYIRKDNNEVVKVRPMTQDERQEDLPLIVAVPPSDKAVEASVEASEAAVETFFQNGTGENLAAQFDKDEEDAEDEDEVVDEDDQSDAEYDPDLGGIAEPADAEEGEAAPTEAAPAKRGRGRPKGSVKRPQGFSGPTNATAF